MNPQVIVMWKSGKVVFKVEKDKGNRSYKPSNVDRKMEM